MRNKAPLNPMSQSFEGILWKLDTRLLLPLYLTIHLRKVNIYIFYLSEMAEITAKHTLFV